MPESALVSSIAAAATLTRAKAKSNGSKAREAILIRRKDEPQRKDRKASPAYAPIEKLLDVGCELGGSYGGRQAARAFGNLFLKNRSARLQPSP